MLLPLASLGDLFGYRRIYLPGMGLFTLVLAGRQLLSNSIGTLIAARTLPGPGRRRHHERECRPGAADLPLVPAGARHGDQLDGGGHRLGRRAPRWRPRSCRWRRGPGSSPSTCRRGWWCWRPACGRCRPTNAQPRAGHALLGRRRRCSTSGCSRSVFLGARPAGRARRQGHRAPAMGWAAAGAGLGGGLRLPAPPTARWCSRCSRSTYCASRSSRCRWAPRSAAFMRPDAVVHRARLSCFWTPTAARTSRPAC